jgi:hypothetical protein
MQTCDKGKAPGLIRGLGLWSAIAVIVGSMIGQAVFLVASDMARELGSPTRVLAVWHNETLSVVAVGVSNEDCSPVGIRG